ncbi:MAG: NfeD family protein [Chloroflexi bacterium]|nr:NfeD family protein [Chloroflexota bacterium]
MCHLILFMPVLALPIFWLMPLSSAIPTYMIIGMITALLYWLIAKAMGRQPETGSESLIGATAEVVSQFGPSNHAQYLVRSHGELWTASSPDAITTGETVSVTAVNGIRLVVRRNGTSAASTADAVRKLNERHCH